MESFSLWEPSITHQQTSELGFEDERIRGAVLRVDWAVWRRVISMWKGRDGVCMCRRMGVDYPSVMSRLCSTLIAFQGQYSAKGIRFFCISVLAALPPQQVCVNGLIVCLYAARRPQSSGLWSLDTRQQRGTLLKSHAWSVSLTAL